MHRRAFLKTGLGVAGLTVAAPYVARAAAPLTLRWAHFAQEDHPANIAAKQFASRVETRTNGAIKINIFPNNSPRRPAGAGAADQARHHRHGAADPGPARQVRSRLRGGHPAFHLRQPAEVYRVLDGPAMAWLAPLAEKQGFILLRNWEYGFRNLTNVVHPINLPDDVKGLKIRTPPELQIQASMEALGAVVQAIAFPELYLALAQKVVDGEENPIAVIYFNKYYEVQKHLAITRHIYNNMIHTVSAITWKKLSPEQQAIFREESTSAGDLMRKLINDDETDQIKKLEAAGMLVTRPDLAPFRAKMDPAYKRIAAYAGEENVAKFRAMVDQMRKA